MLCPVRCSLRRSHWHNGHAIVLKRHGLPRPRPPPPSHHNPPPGHHHLLTLQLCSPLASAPLPPSCWSGLASRTPGVTLDLGRAMPPTGVLGMATTNVSLLLLSFPANMQTDESCFVPTAYGNGYLVAPNGLEPEGVCRQQMRSDQIEVCLSPGWVASANVNGCNKWVKAVYPREYKHELILEQRMSADEIVTLQRLATLSLHPFWTRAATVTRSLTARTSDSRKPPTQPCPANHPTDSPRSRLDLVFRRRALRCMRAEPTGQAALPRRARLLPGYDSEGVRRHGRLDLPYEQAFGLCGGF